MPHFVKSYQLEELVPQFGDYHCCVLVAYIYIYIHFISLHYYSFLYHIYLKQVVRTKKQPEISRTLKSFRLPLNGITASIQELETLGNSKIRAQKFAGKTHGHEAKQPALTNIQHCSSSVWMFVASGPTCISQNEGPWYLGCLVWKPLVFHLTLEVLPNANGKILGKFNNHACNHQTCKLMM